MIIITRTLCSLWVRVIGRVSIVLIKLMVQSLFDDNAEG
jgi:hypothetical protein